MYRLSRCVLLAHEDKVFQGALVASMSIPWGETKGDNDLGGYHLVWTRDLVQSATALLATGQTGTPLRALIWLAAIQRPDGSFPQNSWIDGSAYWSGLQLDEVAAPMLLAWRLHQHNATREHFDPHAMIHAGRGLPHSPRAGHRPGTVGGKCRLLAFDAGHGHCRPGLRRGVRQENAASTSCADFILAYADWLAAHLEEWTVTTQGELVEGFPRHYIRINPTDPVCAGPACRSEHDR